MNKRRWTVTVCNGCDELLLDDCACEWDALRRVPTSREVDVLPVAALRAVLDQYRDIVGGMYAVRAKDPVTACGVLRRGMADATRLRAALLDEYEGTTE